MERRSYKPCHLLRRKDDSCSFRGDDCDRASVDMLRKESRVTQGSDWRGYGDMAE